LAGLQTFQHAHAPALLVAGLDVARDEAAFLVLHVDDAAVAFLEEHRGDRQPELARAAARRDRDTHEQPRAQLARRALELDVDRGAAGFRIATRRRAGDTGRQHQVERGDGYLDLGRLARLLDLAFGHVGDDPQASG